MRLLVVEDNQKLAKLMTGLLAENMFAVDTVSSVEEARAAVEVVDYDLILLDLQGGRVRDRERHVEHPGERLSEEGLSGACGP